MGTRIPSRTPVSILSLMSLDQGRSRTSWNTNLPLCKNRFVTEFTINTIWANITAKAKKVYGFNFTGTVCHFHVKFNVSVVHYQSLRDLGSYRFYYIFNMQTFKARPHMAHFNFGNHLVYFLT